MKGYKASQLLRSPRRRQVKVLFSTYPMAFHTPGGGEVQLLAYQKHLPKHGVDVSLLDMWKPEFLNYDVVHFFSCISGSVHFCNFIKNLGIPLVISSSLWITEKTKHLYPIEEIRAQLSLADQIITNSRIESCTLSDVLDLPLEKFSTVYNGIDSFFFEKASPNLFREQYNISNRFVLNVGNLEPRKNQLSLVRAMRNFPNVKLVLIGHKRDASYAEQVLKEGGDQVVYLGPMPHNQMLLSCYAACDLFCLPSTLETPGLAALEASAQGAPLLLTSEGSCEEYFGDRASYVSPDSLGELRDAIDRSISKADERTKSLSSSFASESFSWLSTTKELQRIYKALV